MFKFNQSNLTDDEFLRLNDIDNERLMEWYDTAQEHTELIEALNNVDVVHESCLDDLYNTLVIRDLIDKDIQQQFDWLQSRIKQTREEFENTIINKYVNEKL